MLRDPSLRTVSKETQATIAAYLEAYEDYVDNGKAPNYEHALQAARNHLIESIKTNERLAYLHLFSQPEFNLVCAELVNDLSLRVHGDHMTYYESEHVFKAEEFFVPITEDDFGMISLVAHRQEAITRIRKEMLANIQRSLDYTPENLALGIAGYLAQNTIPAPETNGMEAELAIKRDFKEKTEEFKGEVEELLRDVPFEKREDASYLRDLVMNEIISSESYLLQVKNHPAYAKKQQAALAV